MKDPNFYGIYERMCNDVGSYPGDIQNVNVWYAGGYWCGLIGSMHRPHFHDFDIEGAEEAWLMGYEDGRGDKEDAAG